MAFDFYNFFIKQRLEHQQDFTQIYLAKQTVNIYASTVIAFLICSLGLLFIPIENNFITFYILAPSVSLIGLANLKLTNINIQSINLITFLTGYPLFIFSMFIIKAGILYLPIITSAICLAYMNINKRERGRIFGIILLITSFLLFPILMKFQKNDFVNQTMDFIIPQLILISSPIILFIFIFDWMRANLAYELNNSVERSNSERGTLLKEIHHRVKNNLQIIISLMRLHEAKEVSDKVITSFDEMQNRIWSMASLHNILYQSDNFSEINMHEYLNELGQHILDSYSTNTREIDLKISCNDINFNLNTSVPLGLIVTELITNSIKHAKQTENNLLITIYLTQIEYKNYLMLLNDNGPGLPDEKTSNNSIGMELIDGLVDQLEGSWLIKNENGLHHEISFKVID